MGMRIRRWHLLAGTVAVVALVAGAVFVWPGGSEDPPPAAAASRPKPVLKPLRLASSPQWTSKDLPVGTPLEVHPFGTTMVVEGTSYQVTMVDTSTSKVGFTLEPAQDITGDGGDWLSSEDGLAVGKLGLVLRWRHLDDCHGPNGECTPSTKDQEGIALVSPDGRTTWATPILSYTTGNYETQPRSEIDVVTDDVALVSVSAPGSDGATKKAPIRAIAVDTKTGRTLWESQDPMRSTAVSGDSIIGSVPSADGTKWTVAGADLRTGKRTWTRPADLDEAVVEQVAGDVALLRGRTGAGPGPERLVFVDIATGRAIAEVDHPQDFTAIEASADGKSGPVTVMSCDNDGSTLIACSGNEPQKASPVLIFRLDKRTLTTRVMEHRHLRVVGAWSGRAQLSGALPGGPQVEFTMDNAGNVIDKELELPGRVAAMTDDTATFITDRWDIEVYERLR